MFISRLRTSVYRHRLSTTVQLRHYRGGMLARRSIVDFTYLEHVLVRDERRGGDERQADMEKTPQRLSQEECEASIAQGGLDVSTSGA